MSEVIVKTEHLKAIADAIRTKNKETGVTYKPAEMAPAILNLFTLTTVKRLESIKITQMPKYQFITNELFTLEGLEVTAYYSDGTNAIVTDTVQSSIEEGTRLKTEQDTTITLTYSEKGITRTTNYLIYVTDLEIVSWSSGTEAQIVAMVQAADAGRINLHDYWSIGQKRQISVAAVSADGYYFMAGVPMNTTVVELILVDYGENYKLTTPTAKRTTGNFIVQYRYVLPYDLSLGIKVGSTHTIIMWDKLFQGSPADHWLNGGITAEVNFIAAQPEFFKTIMKTVQVPFPKDKFDSKEIFTGARKCFLPNEVEVFGRSMHGNSVEETYSHQWTYYKLDANNRKRYRSSNQAYDGISTTPVVYWTRSPALYTGDQTGASGEGWYWITVDQNGASTARQVITEKAGLLPAFVI